MCGNLAWLNTSEMQILLERAAVSGVKSDVLLNSPKFINDYIT